MADLARVVGLDDVLAAAGLGRGSGDVEADYAALVSHEHLEPHAREFEGRIREYLGAIEIPEEPTAYDYLLLGLRPNDLVATFNWDPLLTQAYRRNRGAAPLPQLVFLHGVVGLGYCIEHRKYGPVGEPCDTCDAPLAETPLLYPVRDKNYTADGFISRQWTNLKYMLARAYLVTIFGYGAPRTDVAAREAFMQAWRRNEAKELAEIDIIDVKGEDELLASWGDFITGTHYGVQRSFEHGLIAWHPRRSSEALFMATLMNAPWHDNWYPKFRTVAELQSWIQPLVEEEQALSGGGQFSGTPCPRPD